MANIPSSAQMASNPSMYAIRNVKQGLGGSIGRMHLEINGKRVALTPEALARAERKASASAGK